MIRRDGSKLKKLGKTSLATETTKMHNTWKFLAVDYEINTCRNVLHYGWFCLLFFKYKTRKFQFLVTDLGLHVNSEAHGKCDWCMWNVIIITKPPCGLRWKIPISTLLVVKSDFFKGTAGKIFKKILISKGKIGKIQYKQIVLVIRYFIKPDASLQLKWRLTSKLILKFFYFYSSDAIGYSPVLDASGCRA